MKGKMAEKKKGEITAAMQQAADLVQQYVPPNPQKIQAVKAAGNLAIVPSGPSSIRLDLKNYLKSGDSLSIGLDTAGNAIQTISVKSYMESKDDAVTLDVTFARLHGGLSYVLSTVLNVPGEKIQVVVQNSNYEKVTPAGTTAAAPKAGAPAATGASSTAIETLTAPIALYPDALIAQILQASVDFPGVQKFAGWLKSNASLKGSALQDAAQAAGFAAWLVALAPFPQVVQMMVDKPDWTQGLGQAFVADKKAVFDSIQRLRAMAQAMGNLKTTEQQAVSAETTSTGQQVIIIEPANPQVIYVPVYTQVVYVQPAPPPPPPSSANVAGAALVGFTVGVIIASSHNHYYGGGTPTTRPGTGARTITKIARITPRTGARTRECQDERRTQASRTSRRAVHGPGTSRRASPRRSRTSRTGSPRPKRTRRRARRAAPARRPRKPTRRTGSRRRRRTNRRASPRPRAIRGAVRVLPTPAAAVREPRAPGAAPAAVPAGVAAAAAGSSGSWGERT
jgi:hypothetical protein